MKRILTAAIALTALVAAPIAAEAKDNGKGKGHGRGHAHGHYKHDRDDRDERRAYHQGYRDGRSAYGYQQPYYAHTPVWHRGQVLPYEHRGSVIYDPYRYGLYAPPRGHAWMHVDNDVYLTQLGSGLIVQVLRDSFR